MKKFIFASVLFMSAFFAQAQVSVNVNIGTPPNWGPQGYDNSRYYYLPDIDVYYDVNQSVFIYANSGKWVRERRLPSRYRNYDLYSGYKVVLTDYRGDSPYYYHSKHRAEYPKGYHGKPQKNRGEKPKGNNGNHYGNDKGNSGNNGNGNSQGKNKSDKNHDHGNGKHH